MPKRLAAALASAVLLAACGDGDRSARTKTTTLLGTWMWDVEVNDQGRDGDFWWQYATATERYLTPMQGAKAALADLPFDGIDAARARSAALSRERIPGTALQPGAVVVFATRSGKVGKLQVIGYKSSRDFSFPEAAYLTNRWKSFAGRRPEIPAYHLQVRWALLE